MRMTIPATVIVGLSASACGEFSPMPIPEAASIEECNAMIVVAVQELKLKKRDIPILDGETRFDWTPSGCNWASAGLEYKDHMSPGSSYANIGQAMVEINFAQPKINAEGILVQVSEVTDYDETLTTCRVHNYHGRFSLGGCKSREITPEDRMGLSIAVGDELMKRAKN
ncbi:MAG: hypothetical protein QM773_14800 [Hyphomonadaceae bacterium]